MQKSISRPEEFTTSSPHPDRQTGRAKQKDHKHPRLAPTVHHILSALTTIPQWLSPGGYDRELT
jgi:hypothetical protein